MAEYPNNSSNDEIDLRNIFNFIGLFFSKVANVFLSFLLWLRQSIINYKILLIVIILLSVIGSWVFRNTTKDYYRTTMLLSSKYFNGRLVENGIEKLNLLTGEKNKAQLGKLLGIPEDVAQEIRNFEAEPFVSEEEIVELEVLKEQLRNLGAKAADIEKVLDQLEIENRSTYQITVRVYNSDIINQLTAPIVDYFKNNSYIKKRIQGTRQKLEKRKNQYKKETEKIDSLKLAIFKTFESMADKSGEGSNNVVLTESIMETPTEIYQEGIVYYERFLKADEELFLGSDFELIDGFTTFNKPDNIDLKTTILFGLAIGFSLAFLLVVLLDLNKYLNKIEKAKLTS